MKMMNNVSLPMKSPATGTPKKAYKHVKFMPLSHVRRVVDIRDNSGKYEVPGPLPLYFATFFTFQKSLDKPNTTW